MPSTAETHDFIGIGVGPFNLGLACLTAPLDEIDGLFIESKPHFEWHAGMFLDGAHLQTPFMSDLVTLADPTSPFSFLNYLKDKDRLYSFYIRENFYPLRAEYNDYCRWAADRLDNVRWSTSVTEVTYDEQAGLYEVHTDKGETHRAPAWSWAPAPRRTSRSPARAWGRLPAQLRLHAEQGGAAEEEVDHPHRLRPERGRDLLRPPRRDRRPRLPAQLGDPLAAVLPAGVHEADPGDDLPEYVDYFHALPEDTRYRLETQQKNLFKGIDGDLINAIFDLLYQKKISMPGAVPTTLLTNTSLNSTAYDTTTGTYTLGLRQEEQERDFSLTSEGLVLATGYKYAFPEFLNPVRGRLNFDGHGRLDAARNYSIDTTGRGVYLQNGTTHNHSLTSPDLGMAAYRNAYIVGELLGREHYKVEKSIAFQQFAAPEGTL